MSGRGILGERGTDEECVGGMMGRGGEGVMGGSDMGRDKGGGMEGERKKREGLEGEVE